MEEHTDSPGDDLSALRRQHPGWLVTSSWVAAASGPDRRVLIAQRDGVTVADLTEAALSAKIAAEERAGGA